MAGIAEDPIAGRILIDTNPDECYPMDRPTLGHAIIINNVHNDFIGSQKDVEALKAVFWMIGWDVKVHNNCNNKAMSNIKKEILKDETHKDSNCFCMTVIAHGDRNGVLYDAQKTKALDIEIFINDLSEVNTLKDRPKILIFQACRGHKSSDSLSCDDDNSEHIRVPKLSNMLIAYATVPGYRAFAGGKDGSLYLQTFAGLLREYYKKLTIPKIFELVRQYMARQPHSIARGQCPEERTTLIYSLRIPEHFTRSEEKMPVDYQVELEAVKEELRIVRGELKEMQKKEEERMKKVKKFVYGMADKIAPQEDKPSSSKNKKEDKPSSSKDKM